MKRIALIETDPVLSLWEKEMDQLMAKHKREYEKKFEYAENYLFQKGLMPEGWNPTTWQSGVQDGIFCVAEPDEICEKCKLPNHLHGDEGEGVQVFSGKMDSEVGKQLVDFFANLSKKPQTGLRPVKL